jgi:hypothetical protein
VLHGLVRVAATMGGAAAVLFLAFLALADQVPILAADNGGAEDAAGRVVQVQSVEPAVRGGSRRYNATNVAGRKDGGGGGGGGGGSSGGSSWSYGWGWGWGTEGGGGGGVGGGGGGGGTTTRTQSYDDGGGAAHSHGRRRARRRHRLLEPVPRGRVRAVHGAGAVPRHAAAVPHALRRPLLLRLRRQLQAALPLLAPHHAARHS